MVEETNNLDQDTVGTSSVSDNLESVTQDTTDQSIQSGTESDIQEETQGQTSTQSKRAKTPQESFAELKRKAQKFEKERDEARQFAQQIYQQQNKATVDKLSTVEQEDDLDLNPDDLVEGKHLNKYLKKSTEEIRALKEQLQQQQRISQESAIEVRLKAQFPDFDKVVTKDNVELLSESEPEIAQSIRDTQDLYAKAVSAYKMIKQSGIYAPDLYEEDRQKAKNNAYKPRPTATISPQQGDTPLSKANAFANGLTENLKKQLYAEMIEARKKV